MTTYQLKGYGMAELQSNGAVVLTLDYPQFDNSWSIWQLWTDSAIRVLLGGLCRQEKIDPPNEVLVVKDYEPPYTAWLTEEEVCG